MVSALKLNECFLILGLKVKVDICMTFETKKLSLNFDEY